MSEERARRWARRARLLHVLDLALIVVLAVAVLGFDKPGWLLLLLLPTVLLSVAVQLAALRAAAGAEDLRFWAPMSSSEDG